MNSVHVAVALPPATGIGAMPVAIDIAAERRAGPEERRTTGGLPYRVSRTNTPDLAELRRELDRQRGVPSAGRAPPAAPSPARAEHHRYAAEGSSAPGAGADAVVPCVVVAAPAHAADAHVHPHSLACMDH